MIKIDWKKLRFDYVYFGWIWIPARTEPLSGLPTPKQSTYRQRWMFLGWDVALIPMRKRIGNCPKWYCELFGLDKSWHQDD